MKLEEIVAQRIADKKIFVELPAEVGSVPVLAASGKGLAEAWENSLLALYSFGTDARTEYDRKDAQGKFIDPPSKDATCRMIIDHPVSDPMIHRAFPGGLEDLEEYRMEVVEGVKDHWIRDPNDPTDNRWEYTYHERLFVYRRSIQDKGVDQIATLAKHLAQTRYETRSGGSLAGLAGP